MLTIAVINRHIIAKNRKTGLAEAPIRLSRGRHGKPHYVSCLEFNGRGRLVYDPEHSLPCGATAWLEIEGD
jgi:hypothetical protein